MTHAIHRQPERVNVHECGTTQGYYWHRKLREPPCDPCREAFNGYMRWATWRNGTYFRQPSCDLCGSVFPGHACQAAWRKP